MGKPYDTSNCGLLQQKMWSAHEQGNEDDYFGHHSSQVHIFFYFSTHRPIVSTENALQTTIQPSQIQCLHTVPETSCGLIIITFRLLLLYFYTTLEGSDLNLKNTPEK